jgi:hypothetical protein
MLQYSDPCYDRSAPNHASRMQIGTPPGDLVRLKLPSPPTPPHQNPSPPLTPPSLSTPLLHIPPRVGRETR